MSSEHADDQFTPEESPTRPGDPPRTRTGKWRAVTSAALERGFGRLSDGEFDEGPTSEPELAPVADEPERDTEPPSGEPTTPPGAPSPGPKDTVRMVLAAVDRGPHGTLRIARRRVVPDKTVLIPRRPERGRRWRGVIVVALVAAAQVILLVEHTPDVPAAQMPPPTDPLVAQQPVQAIEVPALAAEPVVQAPDSVLAPPAAPARGSKPLKSGPAARGRKAPRVGSDVF